MLHRGQYAAGWVFPSAEHIAWVAEQPWFDSRKIDGATALAELDEFDALKSEMERKCPLSVTTHVNKTAAVPALFPQENSADQTADYVLTLHVALRTIFFIHIVASLKSGVDPASVKTDDAAPGATMQYELALHLAILNEGSAGAIFN